MCSSLATSASKAWLSREPSATSLMARISPTHGNRARDGENGSLIQDDMVGREAEVGSSLRRGAEHMRSGVNSRRLERSARLVPGCLPGPRIYGRRFSLASMDCFARNSTLRAAFDPATDDLLFDIVINRLGVQAHRRPPAAHPLRARAPSSFARLGGLRVDVTDGVTVAKR